MIEQLIVWSKVKLGTMNSFTSYLKQRIAELEEQIENNSGDLNALKKELERIQKMEMEEDLRLSADKRLLQE